MDIEKLMQQPTAKRGKIHSLTIALKRLWLSATQPAETEKPSWRKLDDLADMYDSEREFKGLARQRRAVRGSIVSWIDGGSTARKNNYNIDPYKHS